MMLLRKVFLMFWFSLVLAGLLTTKDGDSSPFQCLMISRSDGVCESFQGPTQVDFSGCASYLDPIYDVLWRYKHNAVG